MSLFNKFKLISEQSLVKSSHHFRTGQACLKEKHYKQALELFIQAARDYPNQPPILNMIGVTLSQLKEFSRSEEYYQKAIQIDPDYSIGHYNLAICLYNQANYSQALLPIQSAHTLAAKARDTNVFERILLAEGNILLKLDRVEEARRILENYLQNNASLSIRVRLAELSLNQQDYSDVIDLLEPYLKELTSPQDIGILISAYQAAKDQAGLIKAYKQVFYRFHDRDAGQQLIQSYLQNDEYPKAQAIAKIIRELAPDDTQWNEEYAILLYRTGYHDQAQEEAYILFTLFLQQNDLPQAEQIRELLQQWQPNYLQPHFDLINHHQQHKDYSATALEYEKLLEKHSSEVKLYLDYIKVLEKLSVDNRNYLNKILETWEKLSNHFPNDPNVTLGLGKTYASFMKYQEAIQFIEMAVQLKPNLWEAYYELGLLYLAIGNPNRAFSFLSRIRERRKEFPHVEDIIKQIRLILKKDI